MLIDPTDLLDAGEVAEMLGLARRQAVSTYRTRYADFPAPVIAKNSGKCDLWLRADIERWDSARTQNAQKQRETTETNE